MEYVHKTQAAGRWFERSWAEQLGNIGSEINRARLAQGKHKERFESAVDRALELIDLTIADPRWRALPRLRELCLARESVCDAYFGGKEYGTTWSGLQSYFDFFALTARADHVTRLK